MNDAEQPMLLLMLPEHVAPADGHRRTVPYVGPIEVRFAHCRCFTGARVLGDEVLLGAIPIEDMDLVLKPQLQSINVNPANPNIPLSQARSLFGLRRPWGWGLFPWALARLALF